MKNLLRFICWLFYVFSITGWSIKGKEYFWHCDCYSTLSLYMILGFLNRKFNYSSSKKTPKLFLTDGSDESPENGASRTFHSENGSIFPFILTHTALNFLSQFSDVHVPLANPKAHWISSFCFVVEINWSLKLIWFANESTKVSLSSHFVPSNQNVDSRDLLNN